MIEWPEAGSVVQSCSPRDTEVAGQVVGRVAAPGSVVALCGDLGAGKTQFVRGLVEGAGGEGEDVSSPTFTIVHEYTGGRLPVFHFDLYRAETPGEIEAVGWDDYLDAGGVVVVEWGDKFPALFPPAAWWVWIGQANGADQRRIARGDGPPPERMEEGSP